MNIRIAFAIASTVMAVSACGPFHARPDLKRSTLSNGDSQQCVKGHRVITPGALTDQHGYQVGVVSDQRCVRQEPQP